MSVVTKESNPELYNALFPDEIKEILDYFKRNNKNKFGFNQGKILDDEQAKLLLDYITILQQENERLSKNQRYYKNGVFSLEYDKETMSDMIDDYKSRIEKAIEYINIGIGKLLKEEYCCFGILLNILNGKE